jgi:HemY protein
LLIAAAVWGLSWIAGRPGSVTVEWLGYEIRTSVLIVTILLLLLMLGLFMLGWFAAAGYRKAAGVREGRKGAS